MAPRTTSVWTALCLAALAATVASGATFIVDDNSGDPDANPGDGICADAQGDCNLAAAIQETDALPGHDIIEIQPLAGGHYWAEDELVSDSVEIRGMGINRIEIVAVPGERLFTIDPDNDQASDIVFENLLFRDGNPTGTGTQRGGLATTTSGMGRITFDNCRLQGGDADEGGGLYLNSSLATVTFKNSDIQSNFANNAGGGIYLNSGSVTIRNSEVTSNETNALGGGIFVRNVGSSHVFIADSSFLSNIADIAGGGLFIEEGSDSPTVVVERTMLQSNFAGDGAGIDARGGRLHVVGSSVIFNEATSLGAGGQQGGGGVRVIGLGSVVPVVVINGSTISGNSAENGGGVQVGNGVFSIANSTVSGNSAVTAGAGINAGLLSSVRLASVTVTANEAGPGNPNAGDGGGVFVVGGILEARNTLIAGNEARRSGTGGTVLEDADCDGTLTSAGHNLIGVTEGCTVSGDTIGNITNVDLALVELSALGPYGGPTSTHQIGSTSLARDAGNPSGCSWDHDVNGGTPPVTLTTDQRGYVRGGDRCDVGSYEEGAVHQSPIFSDHFESGDASAWSQ